ncbi:hypothetical protein BLOT_016547 [Blomia tropicalis]|nr:hypothetical protein BLOT_016547 [Blomia tropicalis]
MILKRTSFLHVMKEDVFFIKNLVIDKTSINQVFKIKNLSIKKMEEKKLERMSALRSIVIDHYNQQLDAKDEHNSSTITINWDDVQMEMEQQRLNFRSNFEFALLSAFSLDPVDGYTTEKVKIDRELFQLIANYVQQSDAVKTNKIAAIRFCRFLSSEATYLNSEQKLFIRSIADRIIEEDIQVQPIIVDVFIALTQSSPENIQFALSIYERYIQTNFELKITILNLLFNGLLQHQMEKELYSFMKQYHHFLTPDFESIGQLLRLLAKKSTFVKEPKMIFDVFRFISQSNFSLIDKRFCTTLVEKVMKHKLEYENIQSTKIHRDGKCSCCGEQLPGVTLEQFKELKANFRQIIFDKNDQYMIMNLPEYEVQLFEFEELMRNTRQSGSSRYDLVIDGLNISYRRSATLLPDKTGLRTYAKVYKVKDLDQHICHILQFNRVFERFQRILLIGRDHMKKWFALNRLIRQNKKHLDHCFLLNRTRDDNYILYAAVQHPNIRILSSDYFRDHQTKFNEWYLRKDNDGSIDRPNLPLIFNRWLRQSKIRLIDDHRMEEPNRFDMRIHISPMTNQAEPRLHFPIVTKVDPYQNEDHEYEWICCTKGDNKPAFHHLEPVDSRAMIAPEPTTEKR